jgi:anti-sigma regulatory factor (Ser/Thr protein kinase)
LTTERDDSRTRRDIQAATGKDGQAVLTGPVTSEDEPQRKTEPTEPSSSTGQFTSTPRGAQNARRQAVCYMQELGFPPASDASCTVALVVAELAANAVRHGRVPGRDFCLRLTLDPAAGLVRIEVADAASTKSPPTAPLSPTPDEESGRGLLLVTALATRWGFTPRHPVGKTVWAEVAVDVPTSE